MTRRAVEPIPCPACGQEQAFNRYRTLNATQDPPLKEELLAGRLTAFVCTACGHQSHAAYPLLYHDAARQYLIWLIPGSGGPDSLDRAAYGPEATDPKPGYTYRLVRTGPQLIEKIRAFDDGLDDRLLELLKAFLRSSNASVGWEAGGSLLYDGSPLDETGRPQLRVILTAGEEPPVVTLRADAYADFRSKFVGLLPAPDPNAHDWLEVDEGYALALLEPLLRNRRSPE